MSIYTDKIYRLPLVRIWFVGAIGTLLCLMPLSGCDNQQKMIDPKASLERVAEEYWTARLIDKDYKATYDMELEKGSLPFEKYLPRVHNAGEIKYSSIKTKEVKIEKDKGSVDLIVTCRLPNAPKDLEMPLHDKWVLESNQWKHVLPKK